MQDEIQADADVISRRRIGNPLTEMTYPGIISSLFQKQDTVYGHIFTWIRRLQWALASSGILLNNHFHIFFAQVCALLERKIDACETISFSICNDSLGRVFELKAVYEVCKG